MADHQFVGHVNPRCRRCGRTVMEIQRMTDRTCHPMTLPFEIEEQPAPVKVTVERKTTKERAS